VVVPCSLTCNPTRTPPNQVSYLKGSSMESFTLGSTPKIDFTVDQIMGLAAHDLKTLAAAFFSYPT